MPLSSVLARAFYCLGSCSRTAQAKVLSCHHVALTIRLSPMLTFFWLNLRCRDYDATWCHYDVSQSASLPLLRNVGGVWIPYCIFVALRHASVDLKHVWLRLFGWRLICDVDVSPFIYTHDEVSWALMTEGARMSVSYLGSNRVMTTTTSMGPVKAALESTVRCMAYWRKNIRACDFPGPMATRASSGDLWLWWVVRRSR